MRPRLGRAVAVLSGGPVALGHREQSRSDPTLAASGPDLARHSLTPQHLTHKRAKVVDDLTHYELSQHVVGVWPVLS
jgi:hypothetical protein